MTGASGTLRRMRHVTVDRLDLVGTLARVALAGVWLAAGVSKLADLGGSYVAVGAYELLPPGLVGPVSVALPVTELALGVLLLAGVRVRLVAALSAALLLVLAAGVAQAWARGLRIDCGCFGGGGPVAAGQTRYPQELARDAGFLLLAGWLLVRPRTRWSVDRWLAATDHHDHGQVLGQDKQATARRGHSGGQATGHKPGRGHQTTTGGR